MRIVYRYAIPQGPPPLGKEAGWILAAILAATAGAFLLAGFVKGVIGLGLPTVSIGLLGLLMTPVAGGGDPGGAVAGHEYLAGRGRRRANRTGAAAVAAARRHLHRARSFGVALLPHDGNGRATVWLGLALAVYAALGLVKGQFSVPRHAETWLGLLMGAATGAITVATGIFVMPGTPYIQSLEFERDKLVQALGLSFTVSTITLALALALCR